MLRSINDYSVANLAMYGAVISLIVILVRFVWVVLAVILPRWISKRVREKEPFDVRNEVVTTAITYIEENLSLVQDELLHNLKSKYEIKFNRLQITA